MTLNRRDLEQELINKLNKLYGASFTTDNEQTTAILKDILKILDNFQIDLLPYAAVSQFVYSNGDNDFPYFIEVLEELIGKEFGSDSTTETYKKCIKLMEHLELANQQKIILFNKHEEDILRIEKLTRTYNLRTKDVGKLSKQVEELQSQNKNMLANYISILGIFAGILIGAFGALQGFSSMFNNAKNLSIGKILIVSSIGASSVVLILFFLLNGIAKLTDKSLSSSKNENDSLLLRHPTLVIGYCILTLISLIGAALQLCNTKIHFAREVLWWLLPIFWAVYFVYAVHKKDFLFFLPKKKKYPTMAKFGTVKNSNQSSRGM